MGSGYVLSDEVVNLESQLKELEFQRMFSNKMDPNDAFLDIQAGSGGTEAQDLSLIHI